MTSTINPMGGRNNILQTLELLEYLHTHTHTSLLYPEDFYPYTHRKDLY